MTKICKSINLNGTWAAGLGRNVIVILKQKVKVIVGASVMNNAQMIGVKVLVALREYAKME